MTHRKSGDIARHEPPEMLAELREFLRTGRGEKRTAMPSGYVVILTRIGEKVLLQVEVNGSKRTDAPGGYLLAMCKILLGEFPWTQAPPRGLQTTVDKAAGVAVASLEIRP